MVKKIHTPPIYSEAHHCWILRTALMALFLFLKATVAVVIFLLAENFLAIDCTAVLLLRLVIPCYECNHINSFGFRTYVWIVSANARQVAISVAGQSIFMEMDIIGYNIIPFLLPGASFSITDTPPTVTTTVAALLVRFGGLTLILTSLNFEFGVVNTTQLPSKPPSKFRPTNQKRHSFLCFRGASMIMFGTPLSNILYTHFIYIVESHWFLSVKILNPRHKMYVYSIV